MFRSTAVSLFLCLSLVAPLAARGAETEAVKAKVGSADFSALLQGWAVNQTTVPHLNFKLRRAELGFSGSVGENTRWFIKVDVAKALKAGAIATTNDNKILQDLGIGFTLVDGLELLVGQFKSPTTYEGLSSSAELPLPERSLSGRTYGDKRELGVMLTYVTGILKTQAMLSNGGTANTDDTNDAKDLHLRVEVNPDKQLSAGVFATFGDFNFNTKGRIGVNGRYLLDDLTLRAEVVQARDASVNSTGFMADAGYLVTKEIQPVVRFDGIAGATFTGTAITAGANYFVHGHNAKFSLAYAHFNNMTSALGSYTLLNNTKEHTVWLSFQAAL
jgi:hypothetical protein